MHDLHFRQARICSNTRCATIFFGLISAASKMTNWPLFATTLCVAWNFLVCLPLTCAENLEPAAYVDPFIGTAEATVIAGGGGDSDNNGYTHPGAVVPWGMVTVGPDTAWPSTSDKNASGYRFGDKYILGFSQVHLSGTGCPGFGQIRVMPVRGMVETTPARYRSTYHSETARPGFYSVKLSKPNVLAEMAASTRASISRFTFNDHETEATIVVDPSNMHWAATPAEIRIRSNTEIEGWGSGRTFCSFPTPFKVFFAARFNRPAVQLGTWNSEGVLSDQGKQDGVAIGGYARFSVASGEPIEVRIGISFVSVENARENLNAEIPQTRSLDEVKNAAYIQWNHELGKVAARGATRDQTVIFYTALYHMLLHPSVFSDVNGAYRGYRQETTLRAVGYTRYHVFSLWDTYRGLHSFLALVYPERQLDMVKTMVAMFHEAGALPKWELGGSETWTMDGDPAVAVIADTYAKGIRQFDALSAYAAMIKNRPGSTATPNRGDADEYLQYGYLPSRGNDTTASRTLEYANNDWNIGRMASMLTPQKPELEQDRIEYERRAGFWQNLYNPATGWIAPRRADGSWQRFWLPFGQQGFTEGNRENYLFMAVHDIDKLKLLLGGDATFIKRLHEAFASYRLSNEPDFHYPYLYSFVQGHAFETQEQVRYDLAKRFNATPGGLPGNDDAGATSAVAVFDSIGLYPVSPASNKYYLGSPIFSETTILLNRDFYPGTGSFVISAQDNSAKNKYVKNVFLNDAELKENFVEHRDVVAGGTLRLQMSSSPSTR